MPGPSSLLFKDQTDSPKPGNARYSTGYNALRTCQNCGIVFLQNAELTTRNKSLSEALKDTCTAQSSLLSTGEHRGMVFRLQLKKKTHSRKKIHAKNRQT